MSDVQPPIWLSRDCTDANGVWWKLCVVLPSRYVKQTVMTVSIPRPESLSHANDKMMCLCRTTSCTMPLILETPCWVETMVACPA